MGEPKVEVTELIEDTGPEAKPQQANKNGKKSDGAGATSFFTWFMVLALLGVWTSVAVVYFDLVDYQGVVGKLVSYDADGDGDFDVEDAKVLLDEPGDLAKKQGKRDHSMAKDVGARLREALKMQLAIIHERIEAKKIAKMALAEVRSILAKEEEEKLMDHKREEAQAKAWERVEARLKEEDMRVEREMEKAKERAKTEREEVRKQNKEEEEGGENLEREKKLSVSKGMSKGHSKSKKKSSKSLV